MKQYISFFRIRFSNGLQYRAAAYAGIVTQFAWGGMEILMFSSFYSANPNSFPMEFSALTSYIWMQQAFLALYMTWFMENDIFDSISNGNITYELCRPVDMYNMWFVRSMATRFSRAVLRCMPILLFAFLLPKPYGLILPKNPLIAIQFLVSMTIGFLVVVSFCMLIYIVTFFTISPQGVRILAVSAVEFLSGAIVPLPFLPDKVRYILELLPFASMQNAPFRIYSGDISGMNSLTTIALQIFWLLILILVGKQLMKKALQQVVVQGG